MIPPVLPTPVRQCLDTLERSGYRCYAVGGCVRDAALGLIPHDFDLCTAATPEQMRQVFSRYDLVLAGEKHGTVGVITPEGVVEITTFRTEGDYRDNRHPDWVRFVTDIEADLSRRDFTVNAMAWSPVHGFADPFGGEKDLSAGVLRAVGDPRQRFREDSLRILRGLRFSVRYDLLIEENTLQAMEELAPLMDHLARERVFDELCKLLPIISAEKLLQFGKILSAVIPELAPTIGFDQHNPHHAFDLFTHIAHVTAAVPAELTGVDRARCHHRKHRGQRDQIGIFHHPFPNALQRRALLFHAHPILSLRKYGPKQEIQSTFAHEKSGQRPLLF